MNQTFTPFPVLKTERLTLRQLSVSDDKAILALRSDEQVNKYINRAPCTTSSARLVVNPDKVGVAYCKK